VTLEPPPVLPVAKLAGLFKALAEPTRLQILGALAASPRTGAELSDLLGLTPPTISHHLIKLRDAGFVEMTPDAQRHRYSLNLQALRDAGIAAETVIRPGDDIGAAGEARDSESAKVLRDFFDGRRLKQIPAQRKKRVVVLQYLVSWFALDRSYPEKEVNAMLRDAHEDVATLRRELVDYGFLTRDAGIYRVATTLPPRGTTVAQETGDEHRWFRSLIAGATDRALSGHDSQRSGHER